MISPGLPALRLPDLARHFQWPAPPAARNPGWAAWNTEVDDALILRYLYQHHQPRRHLEFGTWQGFGTCLCLESCAATVWTLNLPDGEAKADGSWAYGERVIDESQSPPGAVSANYGQDEAGPRTYHRTDAASYIGRLYREKQLGHRVCQVYCDSRIWDTTAYPAGFFDSVLIDGGHQTEVVLSDTLKALPLLRPGGLMLWHDVCPDPAIIAGSTAVQGVMAALEILRPELEQQCSALFWIDPSYLLLGIKK
jgi:predicted O-methyltransferase YrrM